MEEDDTFSKVNLYNLCLVDKKWHQAATPSLYHTFESRWDRSFFTFLPTLIQHPNLAIHVKCVSLSLDYQNWPWEDTKTFRNVIRSRALALGSPFSDHPALVADKNSNRLSRDYQCVLGEMLLFHTPNIVSIDFVKETEVEKVFKFLDTVACCSQKWHGMRRLRRVKLDVRFAEDIPESHYMGYLSRLAAVAPSVQHLHTYLLGDCRPPLLDWAPVTVQSQVPTPPHMVTFLSSLRSINITNSTDSIPFERTLGAHISHCKSIEEVRYLSGNRDVASFMQLMRPLSRTIKRLGCTQWNAQGNETIWDPLRNDSVAVIETIAGLTSLEALLFDLTGPSVLSEHGDSASTIVPFMCALPKSLRVLAIGGCNWVCLKQGLSQLMDRVHDGMLPNFRTLHVGCYNESHHHPFIEAFAEFGVKMKMHENLWLYEDALRKVWMHMGE
ncbi:uncharacterized protein GLRG_09164 [Colletotrichum graminicola M1.001]|uniref:F-box domain-containing protein n=1 Tax=Colletotrichum graminicola (strain M1.001 / M2 / FGSC 10212) TaxID=645133 RepID=E3QT32_COLGM|nr:uncharacterized protein GLRG_09164 [Colletotrichum graminicola M1.001]EFQ34020.1 hypothetical protein GLRG_09164 [Colletotrichum graminicola M1.001]